MVDGGDGVSDCAIGIAILTNAIESRFTTASICPTYTEWCVWLIARPETD